MGYTHHWTQKRDFTSGEMILIGEAAAKLIAAASGRTVPESRDENHPLIICGGMGTGEPEITAEKISFNGTDEGDMGHETFVILAKRELPYDGATADRLGWAFCKTARKPYDIVVVAILAYLAAKWDFEVSSDGDVEDWVLGVELANEVVGEPIPNPLIVSQLVD